MEPSAPSHLSPDCPFIGLRNDPGTSLAYAAPANFCFHCHTPAVPSLERQAKYCLSENYPECSVYKQPETAAFPKHLRYAGPGASGSDMLRKVAWLALGLILAGIVLWLGYQLFLTRKVSAAQPVAATLTVLIPVASPTASPTVSPFPSPTPPNIPATETSLPTTTNLPDATDFPIQKHALESPIEVDGNQFIVHRVIAGDQLVFLARDYKTSIDVIKAINYKMSSAVWAGSIIVILPGVQSVDPALPSFKTYKVVDKKVIIETLAEKLGVDAALLKHYNRCNDGFILSSGNWLIVPVVK